MSAARVAAAVAVAGGGLALLLPVSSAIEPSEVLRIRLLSGGLSAAIAVAFTMIRGLRRGVWGLGAGLCLVAGVVVLVTHASATDTCVASYDGRLVLIGRQLTAAGAEYVQAHPGLGASDLLLDAGGAADRLWTPGSIASCRFWTGWAGLLAVPLFAGAVCAALGAKGVTLGRAPGAASVERTREAGPAAASAAAPVYDAFLSYRHGDPDRRYAEELVQVIEAHGLRAAIDVRDFAPNEHFLREMERCVKESRFTLCVVTAKYLESDHTNEEAVIAKTLDLSQRTRRVLPLIYERVTLPVWLHGLSGIDFTAAARVDPQDRLLRLLQAAHALGQAEIARTPIRAQKSRPGQPSSQAPFSD